MDELIENIFNEHVSLCKQTLEKLKPQIIDASNKIICTIKNGNKILIFGNGGSASDAQHFAAELVGRFKKERRGLPAIALTTDSSAITAISNDYGFERLFERQVEALAKEGDICFGISTSGNSEKCLQRIGKRIRNELHKHFFAGK
jgi:D-sedoheptulose 7-phosphate isomerase